MDEEDFNTTFDDKFEPEGYSFEDFCDDEDSNMDSALDTFRNEKGSLS